MKKDTVVEFRRPQQEQDLLSTMLREGARHLIAQAVRAEFEDFLAGYSGQRAVDGRRAVVRNGFQPEREILTGLGPVAVQVPKARSRGEEPAVFRSSLVPPYVRSARSVEAALPWLYLHGVSTGNMHEALAALLGPEAAGLSASAVARLKGCWMEEYRQWCRSKLDRDRWVYVWVDGIYSGLRAEDERLCALVVIGVNERGEKKFLAIEDGVRESKQSWREVLLGLKGRGLTIPPKLAVGDGALGFWAAVREVFPETRQQRCWVHKTANVLNYLPKSLQPKAKAALHEIWMAETKSQAIVAFEQFVAAFGAKYPKAVECLVKDREVLLAFYDFPAEHWIHIRTTNPIESTFATIRQRTERTKGCLTRDGMLSMIYKLGMSAEKNWYRLRGFEWLAKVIRGVRFRDGLEVQQRVRKTGNQAPRRAAA
ncbi:MAG: IS256 family transposase [Burkholderiales bacterium]|jgi:transposase-like protein|nr:IS256 family transposase [Burkholderiales bacterium]